MKDTRHAHHVGPLVPALFFSLPSFGPLEDVCTQRTADGTDYNGQQLPKNKNEKKNTPLYITPLDIIFLARFALALVAAWFFQGCKTRPLPPPPLSPHITMCRYRNYGRKPVVAGCTRHCGGDIWHGPRFEVKKCVKLKIRFVNRYEVFRFQNFPGFTTVCVTVGYCHCPSFC